MFRIGVDVGGTFTDFVLTDAETGALSYYKVPSTPDDPSIGIAQGIREMLERFGVAAADVGFIGHGTTVATKPTSTTPCACACAPSWTPTACASWPRASSSSTIASHD